MGKFIKENKKNIKNIIIILVIVYIGYVVVSGEINQRKSSIEFCKQQCNYNSETKTWDLSMKWFFDEEKVESNIATEKSFPEKELDQCINYCKNDLQNEYKRLTN